MRTLRPIPTKSGRRSAVTARRFLGGCLPTMALLTLVGCLGPEDPVTSHGGPVLDHVSFIDTLRREGHQVEPKGPINQPFLSTAGQIVAIDGTDVQVFEYRSESGARAEAKKVSADGSSVGTTRINWMEPPHFYQKGKIIALYLGSNTKMRQTIEAILGPQFAGSDIRKGGE